MVIKTFNVDASIYSEFSSFCKENGLSMSKQITWFMQQQITKEPNVKKEYLAKLDRISKGSFLKVEDFEKTYL